MNNIYPTQISSTDNLVHFAGLVNVHKIFRNTTQICMYKNELTIFCFLLLCCLSMGSWFSQLFKVLWFLLFCFSLLFVQLSSISPIVSLRYPSHSLAFSFSLLCGPCSSLFIGLVSSCAPLHFLHTAGNLPPSNLWLFTHMVQTFQRFPILFRIKRNFSVGVLDSLWSNFDVL